MSRETLRNLQSGLPDLELDYTKLYDEKGMGVIPAVILDAESGKPLTVAFMNHEAFKVSRETGLATFWTRTRQRLWTKGETSGNSLVIQRWLPDCDTDTVVAWVKRIGPVCHRGTESCFDLIDPKSDL